VNPHKIDMQALHFPDNYSGTVFAVFVFCSDPDNE